MKNKKMKNRSFRNSLLGHFDSQDYFHANTYIRSNHEKLSTTTLPYHYHMKTNSAVPRHIQIIDNEVKIYKITHQYQMNESNEKHGNFTSYYRSGAKRYECVYANGKKHGLYTLYGEGGEKLKSGHFMEGKLHGVFTEYNNFSGAGDSIADEPLAYTISEYKHGKLDGKNTTFDSEGNVLSEQYFKEGLPHGKRVEYNYRGNTQVVVGELDYVNGYLCGDILAYTLLGHLRESTTCFVDWDTKMTTGVTTVYYEGKFKDVIERKYEYKVDDQEKDSNMLWHGKAEFYSQSGNIISTAEYIDDDGQGEYLTYHPDGKIMSEGNLKDDMYDGSFTIHKSCGTVYTYLYFIRDKVVRKSSTPFTEDEIFELELMHR